jgi:hypothetical protein
LRDCLLPDQGLQIGCCLLGKTRHAKQNREGCLFSQRSFNLQARLYCWRAGRGQARRRAVLIQTLSIVNSKRAPHTPTHPLPELSPSLNLGARRGVAEWARQAQARCYAGVFGGCRMANDSRLQKPANTGDLDKRGHNAVPHQVQQQQPGNSTPGNQQSGNQGSGSTSGTSPSSGNSENK